MKKRLFIMAIGLILFSCGSIKHKYQLRERLEENFSKTTLGMSEKEVAKTLAFTKTELAELTHIEHISENGKKYSTYALFIGRKKTEWNWVFDSEGKLTDKSRTYHSRDTHDHFNNGIDHRYWQRHHYYRNLH